MDDKLNDSGSPETHLQILFVGIAALYSFVQLNWTGPALANYEPIFAGLDQLEAIAELHQDGETLCVLPLPPPPSQLSHAPIDAVPFSLLAISALLVLNSYCSRELFLYKMFKIFATPSRRPCGAPGAASSTRKCYPVLAKPSA